jgi:hypothetical protein
MAEVSDERLTPHSVDYCKSTGYFTPHISVYLRFLFAVRGTASKGQEKLHQ